MHGTQALLTYLLLHKPVLCTFSKPLEWEAKETNHPTTLVYTLILHKHTLIPLPLFLYCRNNCAKHMMN